MESHNFWHPYEKIQFPYVLDLFSNGILYSSASIYECICFQIIRFSNKSFLLNFTYIHKLCIEWQGQPWLCSPYKHKQGHLPPNQKANYVLWTKVCCGYFIKAVHRNYFFLTVLIQIFPWLVLTLKWSLYSSTIALFSSCI